MTNAKSARMLRKVNKVRASVKLLPVTKLPENTDDICDKCLEPIGEEELDNERCDTCGMHLEMKLDWQEQIAALD